MEGRADMVKKFNTTGICYPDRHYMTDLRDRMRQIKKKVDDGEYFVINRGRQYGKTTTLWALREYLREEYLVAFLSFQQLSEADYKDEYVFVSAFADLITAALEEEDWDDTGEEACRLKEIAEGPKDGMGLRRLFRVLSRFCQTSSRPVILMIDEVDQASNNQVFLDLLAQLRAYYLNGDRSRTFWSVILAGVYDIRNLKQRIRPDSEHQYNSPWNIASVFDVDMSLRIPDITGMLTEYEQDKQTGMDVAQMAKLLYDYTSGYPFLVSRLCQMMDEGIATGEGALGLSEAWTRTGLTEAVKQLLTESNTLFDDMVKKLSDFAELKELLYSILFRGEKVAYNVYNRAINMGTMFGLVENAHGAVSVSNRIFEIVLYNLFLSEEMVNSRIYQVADAEKNQFVKNGQLDMELVLKKFVQAFTSIYADADESFVEENGRRFFLLYLKPIINGVGNYYIEAQTRDRRRTDVIIDYRGAQYVCELKIWHGEEYHRRGERQLLGYLEDYDLTTGYMLSFNFNKNKKTGIFKTELKGRTLIEAVV